MDWQESVDCFVFDDHHVVYEHVDSVSSIDSHLAVPNGLWKLTSDLDRPF